MAMHCKCGKKTITVKKAAIKKAVVKKAQVRPITPSQGTAAAKKAKSAASKKATIKATATAKRNAKGCHCTKAGK